MRPKKVYLNKPGKKICCDFGEPAIPITPIPPVNISSKLVYIFKAFSNA